MRTARIAAATVAAGVLLSACSGSSGGSGSSGSSAASKTGSSGAAAPASGSSSSSTSSDASAKIKASLAAAKQAKTVRITGTGRDNGSPLTIDVHYGSNGSQGSVTMAGTKIELIAVGTTTYFRAPDAFWRKQAGANADRVLKIVSGKFVKVPANSPQASSFAPFTDRSKLIGQITSGFDSASANGIEQSGTSTVAGVKTITYRDTGGKATLDIAATGTPYLMRAVDPDTTSGGTLVLTDWNKPFSVSAPAKSKIAVLPTS